MTMEPHNLRFVRCPKCHQLLVEYPSIPVYKCGGCSTVLKAKHRAVPTAQSGSESGERSSGSPCSLKGSPSQSSGSICSGEQRAVSSDDRPPEATAHETVSSIANSVNSSDGAVHKKNMSAADSVVTHAKHPNKETCSLTDEDIRNPAVMVKETHGEDTGAGSSSDLTERADNVDADENASPGRADYVGTRELSTELHEKAEVVHREERPRMYEGVHVESHKSLIEELERSLSFSSDDDYFSDEAESSGLSDALRNQMGSRRFVLGGKVNGAPRSDPHGRLIEELEMSFSDAEEPMEQQAVAADIVHGNVHDKDPHTLGAESAHPCEESLSSFDNGHLKSEQTSHHESRAIGNGNQGKECIEDDNNTASSVHGRVHIVIADGKIAEEFHEENGKDYQSVNIESAYPFEGGTSSVDDGSIKVQQSFQPNDQTADVGQEMEDDKITNCVHGNDNLVPADEDIAERVCGNEDLKENGTEEMEEGCMEDDKITNCLHGNDNHVPADEYIAERVCGNEELTADGTEEMEEGCMEDDRITNCVHGNDNVVPADEYIAVCRNEELTADGTQEMEEGCMEDDKITNCVHGNDNLVPADEYIAERVCGNEELTADGTQEMEEVCMEDDTMTNCVRGNDNSVLADKNIAEGVDRNEDSTTDDTQEMKESCVEDGNMTNRVHVNDNLVLADEDIVEGVHGSDETADGTGENGERHMENEDVNVAVEDEDNAEKVHENEHDKDRRSLEAESAHLYEGVISSFSDGHVKSGQSFQQDEPIADATEETEEDFIEDGNRTSCIQDNRAAVSRFSSLPNKRNQSKLTSFNKNKEQMTYRCRGSQLCQGRSLDSEDFHSIQNFMESQMDGTSSSISSGSPSRGDLVHRTANKLNNVVRHDRLKKMDELRDQLSRLSSQKGSERSYQKRGLDYQQQSNSYDVEHHLQSVDGDSAPSSGALESYYGHGRPPRYPPPNTFSPTHTYTHCHFGHAQTRLPHNYDPWEFNSYYQSSCAESSILDQESLRLSYKEQKRAVRKHILRPLSGASPFTICTSCFNLVQMPSDIYISKAKVGKMQCGKCSKVLALSFPAVYNANAKSSVDVAEESYNLDHSTITKNEDIASYYAECLTGGPVSIGEDYGASYTRSFPTQAGSSSLAATKSGKKVSDSALHLLMGYDSASQLLRHSRVFEDGYESFESMVPVSSRVSRRKNM